MIFTQFGPIEAQSPQFIGVVLGHFIHPILELQFNFFVQNFLRPVDFTHSSPIVLQSSHVVGATALHELGHVFVSESYPKPLQVLTTRSPTTQAGPNLIQALQLLGNSFMHFVVDSHFFPFSPKSLQRST